MSSSTSGSAASQPLLKWLAARPALRALMVMRAADELGTQMMNVAIGWYVYATTHSPMSLAYIGLAQFLPDICLLLFAGQAADRFDRRRILGIVLVVQAGCLGAFALWSATEPTTVIPVYVLLIVSGAAHAFFSPALSASLPHAVSAEEFPRAVAVTSSAFQICSIVGPAIGGALYAVSGPGMFAVAAVLYLGAFIQVLHLGVQHGKTEVKDGGEPTDKGILAGFRYIRSNRLLLGLISLDLFAVLRCCWAA
jgi:MFS family permease